MHDEFVMKGKGT